MSFHKYGITWPDDIQPPFIELICAKKWREDMFCDAKLDPPEQHLLRACRMLFTDEQFCISPWTEEHAYDWTHEAFCITWGCASSGKSNDYGLFALLDWITDPFETITIMASTTSDMLQLRSFESMLRYFRILKGSKRFLIPGKECNKRLAIINVDDDELAEDGIAATVKASIKGVAVQKGSVEEARANMQGAHLPYVRLILDELSAMREAAMEARHNLSIGAYKDFKLIGLCNPDSIYDLACRHSVPVDGWGSVDPETSTEWRSIFGKVRRHDGFKSPALLDPKRYRHLVSQRDIDRIVREHGGNQDSPAVWTMLRGWPPPQGTERTVLTEAMVKSYALKDSPVWQGETFRVAGLDPAFTADGDGCALALATLGLTVDNTYVFHVDEVRNLTLSASSNQVIADQIVTQVIQILQEENIPVSSLGIDDSGSSNISDIIAMMTGTPVVRFNFASSPPELQVSASNEVMANKRYRNVVTWLYYILLEYAQRGQLKGLPDVVAKQLCTRRLQPKKYPHALESKLDYKKRSKYQSPDEADAVAIAAGVARTVYNLMPGATLLEPHGDIAPAPVSLNRERLRQIRMLDMDENAYLHSYEI